MLGGGTLSSSTNALQKYLTYSVDTGYVAPYTPKSNASGDEYTAQGDRYYNLKRVVDDLNNSLDLMEKKMKLSTNDKERLAYEQEMITLYRSQQKNLNSMANAYRNEKAGLYSYLVDMGFGFDGGMWDDNANIQNQGHLASFVGDQAKEVEEALKRWDEIRYKEIPDMKQEWWDIQDEITNKIVMNQLELFEKGMDETIDGLKEKLDVAEFNLDMLSEDSQVTDYVKGMESQISILKELRKTYTGNIADLESQAKKYADNAEATEWFKKKLQDMREELRDTTLEIKELNYELAEFQFESSLKWHDNKIGKSDFKLDLLGDNDIAETEKVLKEKIASITDAIYSIRKKMANIRFEYPELDEGQISDRLMEMQEELQDKIGDLYDAQSELQENAISLAEEKLDKMSDVERKIMDVIQKRIEKENELLDKNLDDYRKYMQEKIDIINKQYDDEDYEKNLKKEQEEALKIQKEINQLMLDDSLEARNKERELREKLAEQQERIDEMRRDREKQQQIDAINDLIEAEETRVDNQKENNDKLLENDALYAEAKKAIQDGYMLDADGNYVKLEDALISYENKFGDGMSLMGDKIKSELIDNLKLAQDEIYRLTELIKKSQEEIKSGKDLIGQADVDVASKSQVLEAKKKEMGALQKQWWDAYNSYSFADKEWSKENGLLKELQDKIDAISSKYGVQKGNYSGYSQGQLSGFAKDAIGQLQREWWNYYNKNDLSTIESSMNQGWLKYLNTQANELRGQYGIGGENYSGYNKNTMVEQAKKRIGQLQREYMYYLDITDPSTIKISQDTGGYLWNLNREAEDLRKKWGIGYEDLRGYATGGVNDETGVAMLHGTKSAPEVVLNSTDAGKLWNLVKQIPMSLPEIKLPTLGGNGNDLSFNFDNLVKIEGNVDENVANIIPVEVEKAFNKVIREFNKRGITARV